MSYLIAEDQLKIISFNRLVRNLNGSSDEDFLTQISKLRFKINVLQKQSPFQVSKLF